MANFLAGLLDINQGKKNNVLANKFFYQRQEPELRTQYPYAYGLLGGLAGTAPDEMGGSVLDPQTARVQEGAKVGFPLSVVAALSPLTKGMSVGASTKNVGVPLAQAMERKPFVYPQQKALDAAQRNAALPVEQGGLGLRPDNTPMERAQAMGFDTDLLHGTQDTFQSFNVPAWATTEPQIADIYAGAKKAHLGGTRTAGPNVMPLTSNGKMLEVSDAVGEAHGYYPDNLQAALNSPTRRGNLNRIEGAGYDGAKITDMMDLGGIQDQYVFPTGKSLRSRFAAFDPMRRNENDLLAGALPFTALIDQDNRNYLRGLLNP